MQYLILQKLILIYLWWIVTFQYFMNHKCKLHVNHVLFFRDTSTIYEILHIKLSICGLYSKHPYSSAAWWRISSLWCLVKTKTLLLSFTVLSRPYKAVYIVSGEGALYSVGNEETVISRFNAVSVMLVRIFSQRRIKSSGFDGVSNA